MSAWKAKRFWSAATVAACAGGYRVLLDDRVLLTPGQHPLVLPTRALAQAVAEEWNAQGADIRPLTMPCTRSANSAVERVAPQRDEVAAMLAAYGGTDLLCYRAQGPADLVRRQADAWDPLLDWAASRHGARLRVGAGVVPVAQDPAALAALAAAVGQVTPFPMAALHDFVTLTGSLVLGLATAEGVVSAGKAWTLSRIDEAWQIEHWGADAEAEAAAAAREAQLHHAERFWGLCFAG